MKTFSDYKYSNSEIFKSIISQLCNKLQDPDLPVRVKAATAIPHYLIHSESKMILVNYLGNILEVYLKLISEIDLDELLVGLECLVGGFGDSISTFSVDLVKQLVMSYRKCIETVFTINSHQSTDNFEEKEVDSTEISCVKTIVKLFDISAKNIEIYKKMEEEVSEMLRYSLSKDGISHLENTYLIFKHLVNKSQQISQMSWTFFPIFLNIILDDILSENPELTEKIITLLLNYIINDPMNFIAGKDETNQPLINKIILVIEKLLKRADLIKLSDSKKEEYEHCVPMKILIVLLETFKGKIDSFIEFIIKLVISELSKSFTLYYKSILVQVIALCLYNNPELTLFILDSMNVTANLFELWITLIRTMKHDFELRRTIYGFTSILLVDPTKISPVF